MVLGVGNVQGRSSQGEPLRVVEGGAGEVAVGEPGYSAADDLLDATGSAVGPEAK